MTGPPRAGKTTLVRKVAADLARLRPVGFFTVEIRDGGARRGFELVSLDGRRGVLSHASIRGPHRVGKYGVDVEGFDRFLEGIQLTAPDAGLVVIDEIGKMECFSGKFQALVRRLFDSGAPVLATISAKGGGLIAEVKQRPDVDLLELSTVNRDALAGDIVTRFV